MGAQLASLLNTAIDDIETEDRPRADIVRDMAGAAGIDSGTVNEILDGDINCPPRERFSGFSEVLNVTVRQQISAAESDGCQYSDSDANRRPFAQVVRLDKSPGSAPQLFLYDEIGPAWLGMIDDAAVVEALDEIPKAEEFIVRINSPGGDVHIGNSIHNALARHPGRVIVEVDGLAASIASIIAMAGDEIRMFPNSMMMVHRAWTIAMGNSDDFAAMSEVLSKHDDGLTETYHGRTGVDKAAIQSLMAAETWMTAAEAVDANFAHRVISSADSVAACVIPEQFPFRNVPESLAKYVQRRDYAKREVRRFPERNTEEMPQIAAVLDRKRERQQHRGRQVSAGS